MNAIAGMAVIKKKRFSRILSWTFYVIFLCVIVYGTILVYRGLCLYSYVKNNNPMISSGLFEFHPDLGFAPRPGAKGKMMFRLPPDTPLRYDQNRWRIGENAVDTEMKRPLILVLGCSFTHGDACLAEQSYPYLLGIKLGGSSINAGFCAYGLSQMLIRARELIPELKPDYVIVQYSAWLPNRAMTEFAPALFGKRPQPFFFLDKKDEQVKLHPPVFRTTTFDYPVAKYRGYGKSFGDACSFLFRVALPMSISNDFQVGVFRTKQHLRVVPFPTHKRAAVVNVVYREIQQLCEKSGGKMVVCILGSHRKSARPLENDLEVIRRIPNVLVADAWKALISRLPDTDRETFMKAYAHYRGTPPVFVNGHPNPAAHAIIAKEIEKVIRRAESMPADEQ